MTYGSAALVPATCACRSGAPPDTGPDWPTPPCRVGRRPFERPVVPTGTCGGGCLLLEAAELDAESSSTHETTAEQSGAASADRRADERYPTLD